jgi:formylglycine-generating enzyme required for sulfatase activity
MTITCPTADLERLFAGGLPERETELLEQHVLDCPSCFASLKKLFHSGDTMSGILASDETRVDTFAASPMVDELIRRLATLRSSNSQASQSLTQPPCSLDATEDFAPANSSRDALTDFLAPPQSADELGRLGKYRILKVLGHGGMGVVYLAEDIKLKRSVAIKAMLPALAASASAGKRFLLEAQAMAALEHDHIVRIYQVDEDRGIPYLAMEFLKGETLDERLKRDGKLPVADVLRIGREIAEALGAAHASGLIHRDIKPGNIWLEAPRTRVKILDFGLARAAAQQDAGLTQQGAIVGTPAYMAPEQARGASVDARCDLFSLGVVLYRLCTGQQPFRGGDSMSTLMEVAMRDPPPPVQLDAEIPQDLSDLIMKLLEKDPDRRIGSAAEVVKALSALEQKCARAQAPEEPTAVMTAVVPPTTVAPRRRRWLPALIVALALVGGLLGAWAAGLIRFHTDEGDFVIQTNDPEFAFSVSKDGGITLVDRKTDRTYEVRKVREDKNEIVLEVVDVGGHLTFKTKTFTIKRGDTVALSAWFERKETVEPTLKPDTQKTSNAVMANAPALLKAPFTKEQAEKARAEWAAYLKVPERKQLDLPKGVKLELALIPPGHFRMGTEGDNFNEVAHDVTITKPFYMAVTETTQEQYEAVIGKNPSEFSAHGNLKEKLAPGTDTAKFPVDSVTWPEAEAFGKAIGAQLPTEAQWEYACRSGTTTKYYFGETFNGTEANVKDTGLERTTKVASYPANAFGLFDMFGNVREWCRDWYADKFDELGDKDPERTSKQSEDHRVLRGGSWNYAIKVGRSAHRDHSTLSSARNIGIGFRVIVYLPSSGPAPSLLSALTEKEAKKLQADWAAKLKLPVETSNKIGMTTILVPPAGEPLLRAYYLGKYEVTQVEWEIVMGFNPSGFGPKNPKAAGLDTSKFPVENLNWFECVEFLNKLSDLEGFKPYYDLTVKKRAGRSIDVAEVKILGGAGYHLPTDAEWEHACRAGTKTKYHCGDKDEDLPEYAWFKDNSDGRTHAVGEKKPNAFGFYDMHGNVREWNEDMLTNSQTQAPERVNRGGYFNNPAKFCTVSSRYSNDPALRTPYYGLRVARVALREAK